MSNAFANHTITFFLPVLYLRCAHSYFLFHLSSRFNHRYYQHNVSTTGPRGLQAVIHTRVRHVLSHSDATYIRVFWEAKTGSRRPFNHLLQSCRRYYLGDEQRVIPSVPKILFIKVYS